MAIFKIEKLKRNYECTNVVAIVADELPARFSPDVFKRCEVFGCL
jgi:hypothetical protein